MSMKRFFKWFGISCLPYLIIAGLIVLNKIVWPKVDADMNPVIAHKTYPVSDAAKALHDELWIADLHADSLLWRRNPKTRHDYGQSDLPRMREGGVEFQIFSTVTKSPKGLNFDGNDADAPDDITRLAQAQLWPPRTWDSIYERAAYQAQRLQKLEKAGEVHIVRTARGYGENRPPARPASDRRRASAGRGFGANSNGSMTRAYRVDGTCSISSTMNWAAPCMAAAKRG